MITELLVLLLVLSGTFGILALIADAGPRPRKVRTQAWRKRK